MAGLRGEQIPLPHEAKAELDAGTLDWERHAPHLDAMKVLNSHQEYSRCTVDSLD